MEEQYQILHYGMSGIDEKWAFSLNHGSFVDRIYYIIEEGAGYIENGVRHHFIKNHFYIINHSVDIQYFAENYNFNHAFIDYVSSDLIGYGGVIEIFPEEGTILKADADALKCFFEKDKINRKSVGAFFPYNERLMMILKSIIYDVNELYPAQKVENSIVADSVRYIHKHYFENISAEGLAKRVHLSRNQFSRIFLKTTNLTPYQYIKEYRFQMALAMLKRGLLVGEIAQKCGFLSTSAFSNSFKKRFGFPPVNLK